MTATEAKGINEEPLVRRVHLGAGFILLLKQVLGLFCPSQGIAVYWLHWYTSLVQCF